MLLGAFAPDNPEMVPIPGGTFLMGSDKDALLREFPNAGGGMKSMLLEETPAHKVTIPPFSMDCCEVTNGEFQRFVHARPEWSKNRVGGDYLRHWNGDAFPDGLGAVPVVFVSWHAAVAYAGWAGKRLPTEAEWEFAACGGEAGARYPWGREAPTPKRANFGASGIHGPVSVRSYAPNPYGLFELAGNVWEFCLDVWGRYRPDSQHQTEADLRGMRLAEAERRVIRGGSFDGGAFNLRVTSRDSHRVNNPVGHVGFRCAKSKPYL